MKIFRLLAALALCTAPVTLLGPAASAAGPTGGSANYDCQGDNDATSSPTPVTFSLTAPPDSVRPGDTLSLVGSMGITLSSADEQQSQLLLTQNASLSGTDFALVVNVGATTINLKPKLVTGALTPLKTPWTMSADVTYPDVTIPASATGAVTVAMPSARTGTTKVAGAPSTVTFNAQISQDSPLFPTRNFACWTDAPSGTGTIAQIPVTSDASSAPASPSTGQASTGDGSGGAASSGGSSALAAGAAPGGGGLPAAPPAPGAPPASTSAQPGAPAGAVLAKAPIPPRTVSHKTFVPGWMIAVFVAIAPAAAIAFAVAQRKQLGRLSAAAISASS